MYREVSGYDEESSGRMSSVVGRCNDVAVCGRSDAMVLLVMPGVLGFNLNGDRELWL